MCTLIRRVVSAARVRTVRPPADGDVAARAVDIGDRAVLRQRDCGPSDGGERRERAAIVRLLHLAGQRGIR